MVVVQNKASRFRLFYFLNVQERIKSCFGRITVEFGNKRVLFHLTAGSYFEIIFAVVVSEVTCNLTKMKVLDLCLMAGHGTYHLKASHVSAQLLWFKGP